MPFKSLNQMKKCFVMKNSGKAGSWNCKEWAHKTKDIAALPEKKKPTEKTAAYPNPMNAILEKIAIRLFDPIRNPQVPIEVIEGQRTAQVLEDSVIRRAKNVSKRKGTKVNPSV